MRRLRSRSRGMPSGASLLILGLIASLPARAAEMLPAPRSLGLANIGQVSLPSSSTASVVRSRRPVALRPALQSFSVRDGFYDAYLVPRMSARLRGENVGAASEFANPMANPWTRDEAAADRVEQRAMRAAKGAIKRYALERLGIDRWSLPLVGRRGSGAIGEEPKGVRMSLGVSHLAPRADLSIPTGNGARVLLSADARGHVGTTFEPASSRLRVAADYDVPGHAATVRLSLHF